MHFSSLWGLLDLHFHQRVSNWHIMISQGHHIVFTASEGQASESQEAGKRVIPLVPSPHGGTS